MRALLIPALLLASSTGTIAARTPPTVPAGEIGYSDIADLALASPVVVIVTIGDVVRLKPEESTGAAQGMARIYVEAQVGALIRGKGGLPAAVQYLVDVPADRKGRPPKLKGAKALLFADRVPGRPGELRLTAPDAQLPWSPATEQTVRGVLTEALGPQDPPRVTGVGNAFYVPGSLPGESETQIFLQTADERPVSLSILRRPGEDPRLAVALGELVDEAAAPPARDTLLWYRLACALPSELPARSTASLSPDDAAAAQRDYRLVLDRLGPCGRLRHPG